MTVKNSSYLSGEEARTLLRQIGTMNLLAVSGGRTVWGYEDDLILPVKSNIDVRIQYVRGLDLYLVQRVRRIVRGARKGERIIEKELTHVGAEEIGEVVYQASLSE
jgi:hypothetical protein